MIYNGINKPPLGIKLNRAHRLSKGLVGCWLFNEGCGKKVYDHSGYGHHGTLNGMAFPATATSGWNPGRKGVVLRFDGDNDYINCGNDPSLNITEAITVEAWVKPTDWGLSYRSIVAKEVYTDSWDLYANIGVNLIQFYVTTVSGTGYAQALTLVADQWAHVVGTYDGAKVRVYHNGVKTDGSDLSGYIDLDPTNDNVFIGKNRNGNYYTGSIDGVKIYDRGLTASEISQLYRTPFCMFEIDDSWVLQAGKSKLPIGANIAAAKLLL